MFFSYSLLSHYYFMWKSEEVDSIVVSILISIENDEVIELAFKKCIAVPE